MSDKQPPQEQDQLQPSDESKLKISVDQLRVGLYVELDIGWLEHPFFFRSFLIKNEKQLQIIRRLNLTEVTYDPGRSIEEPIPAVDRGNTPTTQIDTAELAQLFEEKKRRIECMNERRHRMRQCEKQFEASASFMRQALHDIRAQPGKTIEAADQLIDDMVGPLFEDPEVALHLVNINESGQGANSHIINVTVLSLALGKTIGLDRQEMRLLGIGALFHDIGKLMIPEKILHKAEPLNQAEQNLLELHTAYGLKIGRELGILPVEALAIINQHHETLDGEGYPKGLNEKQIYKLAKIVAIADSYDLYCNNPDPRRSLSPYEAISYMFAREKHKYDEGMLGAFISSLGIYPPGTVVELSNDKIGLVVSINAGDLLRPNVMLYSKKIPRKEAIIIDLREEDLSIIKSLRPATLPRKIHKYLGLESNVSHYFISSEI